MWLRVGEYTSHAFLPCERPSPTKTAGSPRGPEPRCVSPSSSMLLEGNFVLNGGVGKNVVGVDYVECC
eukprot:1942947-Rhodomonas_salina.1